MQRGHFENALAMGGLEKAHLQNHADGLHHEDAALDSLGVRPEGGLKIAQAPAELEPPKTDSADLLGAEYADMDPKRLLALGLAPDLKGYTLRQVMQISGKVRLSLQGWGRVVAQDPAPGMPVGGGLSLRLAPGAGGA